MSYEWSGLVALHFFVISCRCDPLLNQVMSGVIIDFNVFVDLKLSESIPQIKALGNLLVQNIISNFLAAYPWD